MGKVVCSKVRVNAFEDINLLAGVEGKTVSRLIKDALFEHCSRRADVLIECVHNGSMRPEAVKHARIYADLAKEFSK